MPVPQITITPAGFAAIVNAENTGTAPVKLTHVGLTAQHFDVGSVGAAVPGEGKRLTTFGGKAVADDTLHLNVRDDSADTYTLRGFGLYLQDGTLFAVYSQATPIMEKAAAATLLLATDIRFAKITATSIEVGDIDFINPPASTTQMGVVRLATEQEADTGSDPTTAITPRGLAGYINRRFGDGAPSTFVKKLLSVATAAIFRAELGLKSAAVRDEGAGNGLDADKLDGVHGDYYLDWRNFTGLPSSFPPAPHNHTIAQVEGLASELAKKADKTGDTFTGTLAVNGAALRAYGWNGVASNGLLMLGDGGSYIMKNGAYFDFTNSAGGYSATLSAGGTIWTSGNFDPASKLNVTGGSVNGWLTIRAAGPTQPAIRFANADTNGASRTVLQSVVGDGSAFAELHQVSNGFIWYNNAVGETARLDNFGNFRASTLRAFGGVYATQVRLVERGWNNQVGRWVDVLESDGSMSLYAYDGGGGTPTQLVEYRAAPAGGGNYVSLNGELRVRGRTAAIWFNDRNLTKDWAWYAQEGMARLNLAGYGDRVFITEGGALSTTGGFDFGSSIKLKSIDGPMPYGLAEVELMELAAGYYKPEYNNDGRRRLFFVAEQLAELVPEAVNMEGVEFNGERVPSIKLDQLLPVMAKAIQELAAEVRALKEGR